VTAFGQRLVDAGYRVSLPPLFGRPGAPFNGGKRRGGYAHSPTRAALDRVMAFLAERLRS